MSHCPHCKSIIVRREHEQKANWAKRKYCSAVCLEGARGARVKPAPKPRACKSCSAPLYQGEEERPSAWKSRRYCLDCGIRCQQCHGKIRRSKSETLAKLSKRKYCSNRCKGLALKGKQWRAKAGPVGTTRPRKVYLEMMAGRMDYEEPLEARPKTRGECSGARPCVWISCVHNMYLEVTANGGIKLRYPSLQPEEMKVSCALDVADDGGVTLKEISEAIGVTAERVRQIEESGMVKMRASIRRGAGIGEWE